MDKAQQLIEFCQAYLENWDAASSTQYNRGTLINRFITWVSVNEPADEGRDLPVYFKHCVRSFIQDHVQPGSANYHNTLVSTFKSILHWLKDERRIDYAPVMDIKWRANEELVRHNTEMHRRKQQDRIKPKEINKLLAEAKRQHNYRVYMAILMMYNFGIRIGEMCSLQFGHFEKRDGRYWVKLYGKSEKRFRRESWVEIGKPIYEIVKTYQQATASVDTDHVCGCSMLLRKGEPITTTILQQNLQDFCQQVIRRRPSSHTFRRSGITNRLEGGHSMQEVARMFRCSEATIRKHYDTDPNSHNLLSTIVH
jgi:integrase